MFNSSWNYQNFPIDINHTNEFGMLWFALYYDTVNIFIWILSLKTSSGKKINSGEKFWSQLDFQCWKQFWYNKPTLWNLHMLYLSVAFALVHSSIFALYFSVAWMVHIEIQIWITRIIELGKSHSQMLGKVESGGGLIFKVVLEC